MRLSPCVLVQPDGWARGEREGYGEPCDVTSLSLSLYSHVLTSSSAPPGVEIVQYHSEAQLKEYGEAYQYSEVCGHVYITHVVEP